jgi:hypothetical protein
LLQTRAAGYVIDPGQLDLDEFTGRITAAQHLAAGDPAAAAREIRDALTLWRAPGRRARRLRPGAGPGWPTGG